MKTATARHHPAPRPRPTAPPRPHRHRTAPPYLPTVAALGRDRTECGRARLRCVL